MKYFIDTEFIEDGKTIDLISIGIVSEDNRELYLESSEVDWSSASRWVLDNVFTSLQGGMFQIRRKEISSKIIDFLFGDKDIQFWGYFADYDWVAFCQLFGRMIDLPDMFPKYCNDLKQLQKSLGVRIRQENSVHNALQDAKWVKEIYERLTHGTKTAY